MAQSQTVEVSYNIYYTIKDISTGFQNKFRTNESITSVPFSFIFGADELKWSLCIIPKSECIPNSLLVVLKLLKCKEDFGAIVKINILDEKNKIVCSSPESKKSRAKIRETADCIGNAFNYAVVMKFRHQDNLKLMVQLMLIKTIPINELKPDVYAFQSEFGKLFEESLLTDFNIRTSDGEVLSAHKAILAARSPVFMAMLTNDMQEVKKNEVKVPDFDSEVMRELLRFIYSNTVGNLEEIAVDLMFAAEKYQVTELQRICCNFLARNVTKENVIDLIVLADQLNGDNKIYFSCINVIFDNYKTLSKSEDWKKLDQKLMAKILDQCKNRLSPNIYL